MALSVLIYEDNTLLRESLSSMVKINEALRLTGAFENVLQIEGQVREHDPDIVFMDIDMPGMTGIEAVKKIRVFNTERI